MTDLVSRLLEAITAKEEKAHIANESEGYSLHVSDGRVLDFIEDNGPSSVLRRCSADRKIVARHSPAILHAGGGADYFKTTRVCSSCEPNRQFPEASYPCPTILALAEAYGLEVTE